MLLIINNPAMSNSIAATYLLKYASPISTYAESIIPPAVIGNPLNDENLVCTVLNLASLNSPHRK